MKIQLRQSGGTEILGLEGDLDFHSSPEVRSALARPAEKPGAKILIDMAAVGYVDSSGLAVFVEVFQKLKRSSGKLILFDLSPAVRSVFEISRLDSIFTLAASEKEALAV